MPTPLKVVVRVRPVLSSKGEEDQGINQYVQVNATAQQLTTGFGPRAKTSTYTNTLGPKTNQEEFFQKVGVPVLDDIWGGKSSTVLAYGPRGSGKRFTTFGTKKEQGLIPRFATQLFERLSAEKNGSYKVEFSFFELYCEECNDLLLPSGRNLPVSYIENVGYHALGLTRCPVMDYKTLDTILEASLTARAVSAVSSNTDTIQAHTFFQLIVTRTSVDKTTMKASETTSTLLIGDLGDAGGGEEERAAISSINASPGDSHAALRGVLKHLNSRSSSKGSVRDDHFNRSSLTQVLRTSLCGNASTTIIVALPPSDIDKDATDFTLAVANQLIKIRTEATTNIDGRNVEIENTKTSITALRSKLAKVSSSDSTYTGIQSELNIANDLLDQLTMDWGERVGSVPTTVQKALNVARLAEIQQQIQSVPHLSNISNDPMIDGRVIHFLMPGKTQVGAAQGPLLKSLLDGMHTSGLDNSLSIALMGHSVDQTHCAITNENNSVLTLMNMSQHTCVGGDVLHPSDQHPLQDGAWVLFGKSFDRHVYEVVVPSARNGETSRPKWDAVVEAMSQQQLVGLQRQQRLARMRPSASRNLQNRVLHIIPHIDEANFLAKELARPKKFDINIVASGTGHANMGRRLSVGAGETKGGDDSGTKLSIEVIVQEHDSGSQPSIWNEYKFLERSFGMRQMHMQFVIFLGGNIDSLNKKYPASKDPFYDPLQDVLVGTAVAYLNPLSYILAIDQPLTILDQRGSAEGELLLNIKPIVYRDDLMKKIVDTDEENEPRLENYIGSTVQIHLSIQGCRHVDLSKSDGVYVMYRWLNEEMDTTTIPSMDSNKENPTLDFTKTYEFYVTPEFIQQIQEDVIEFHVMCKGNEKNQVKSAPRLGFLSEVGAESGVQSLHTPRGKQREGKSSGGSSSGSKSGGGGFASKSNVGGADVGGLGGANYGSAVDAHKNELEKAAMRERIRELENELLNAQNKSKSCVLL